MARLLDQQTAAAPVAADEEESSGRSTARALATAIALLMISLLVVTRSRSAFDSAPADADASFASGDVRLSDDDQGSTLFDIPDMIPGRSVSDCIAVTYEGNVVPIDVTLEVDVQGALAEAMTVRMEGGSGGGFHDCAGFEPGSSVYDGSLPRLASLATGRAVMHAVETPQTRTFRFTLALDPDVPVEGHARASADFVWSADA